MSFKRMMLSLICLLAVLGFATTSQAASYSLVGGGGQVHIGGGLPLPIQPVSPAGTGAVLPPLGIPHNPAITIQGTVAMSIQQKISVPMSALLKTATPTVLGVFTSNPTLYAVGTNLSFAWPGSPGPAVFSTMGRPGAKTIMYPGPNTGQVINYSNPLADKFGGPARFLTTAGTPGGLIPTAPVTIYGIAIPGTIGMGGGNPPCTHTALTTGMGGPFPPLFPTPACVAALAPALASASVSPQLGAHGGAVGVTVTTMPVAPVPGVGIGKFGPGIGGPTPGNVTFFTFTPNGTMAGFTNMAASSGYPWTTGTIMVTATAAAGGSEMFTITGMDFRTAGGAGVIQMVGGALSARTLSLDNANRAWVRLDLVKIQNAPSVSPAGLAAAAGLMLLAVAYAVRQRKLS